MKIWVDAQLSPAIAEWIRSEFQCGCYEQRQRFSEFT